MLPSMLHLVANDRPLINVDITLLFNLGLWLALYVFLRATFWKPMLALIAAREEGTEGTRHEAKRLETEARAIRERFDASLLKARAEAAVEREKIRAEGSRQEAEIQQATRNEVNAMVESRRAEIAVQKQKVRGEVMVLVPAIAQDIVRKILSREVAS